MTAEPTKRLSIPSLVISVPLYYSHGDAQEIVDNANSAALMQWRSMTVIADHASQGGFWRLQRAKPHHTVAYVTQDGKTTRYCCNAISKGNIIGGKLYDQNGNSVHDRTDIELLIYTCTGKKTATSTEVWLTIWKKEI